MRKSSSWRDASLRVGLGNSNIRVGILRSPERYSVRRRPRYEIQDAICTLASNLAVLNTVPPENSVQPTAESYQQRIEGSTCLLLAGVSGTKFADARAQERLFGPNFKG